MDEDIDISVVIPVFNEEENVTQLYANIVETLNNLGQSYEIIFIDDGSYDKTFEKLKSANETTIIRFRKNFGQSAAMLAGFKHAIGKIIISMDGDGQNDPKDIPLLIETLEKNYDAVCGWRYNRKDSFFKRFFSKIANSFRQFLTDEEIHDSGCSLRAYKRETLKDLEIYGEMHRYIPALLHWKGFKIGEVKVNHLERKKGNSKYNWLRLFKGFLDLLVVVFWQKYSARPIHIFGGLGLTCSFLGGIMGLSLFFLRIMGRISLIKSTLPLLSALLFIIGIQFFLSGILADIMLKIYYGVEQKTVYQIEDIIIQK